MKLPWKPYLLPPPAGFQGAAHRLIYTLEYIPHISLHHSLILQVGMGFLTLSLLWHLETKLEKQELSSGIQWPNEPGHQKNIDACIFQVKLKECKNQINDSLLVLFPVAPLTRWYKMDSLSFFFTVECITLIQIRGLKHTGYVFYLYKFKAIEVSNVRLWAWWRSWNLFIQPLSC